MPNDCGPQSADRLHRRDAAVCGRPSAVAPAGAAKDTTGITYMRLWTLHPKYLDRQGLLGLWQEALLAQRVLAGQTRGFRHHPQLDRFRTQPDPEASIAAYLRGVYADSLRRGYRFDVSKIADRAEVSPIEATEGQLAFERRHLLKKLRVRAPERVATLARTTTPEAHPLFTVIPGPIAPWERSAG